MGTWFKTREDLPTVRLVLLVFCGVLVMQGPLGTMTLQYSLGWGLILNQIGVMLLPIGLLCWRLRFDTGTLFPLYPIPAREWRWVVVTAVGVIILSDFALAATEALLPIPPQIQMTLDELLRVQGAWDFLKKLLLFCLLPAVAEELFFRGFCQTSLAHRVGAMPAILVTALLFALAHGNVWYLHLYFGLGCFLGWIYERSGSLWPAIIAHFMNNSWTFLSHQMGWEIAKTPVLLQVLLLIGTVAGFVLGVQGWKREAVAR